MHKRSLTLSIAVTFSLLLCATAFAALDEQTEAVPVSVNGRPYSLPYRHPLYSTLAGYLNVHEVTVPNERVMHLNVPGFHAPVPVHAVIQDQSAPLAVVLLGIGGRADNNFSRLWPSWLADAGYNVLFFDSTFRPSYLNITHKGPAGNMWAESETVRDIIDSFLKHPDVQGKVTRIGVAGMSYGAVQALILGRMAVENRLPFAVSAIQAYSPPINLEKTAEIFDNWHRKNRWKYTLIELDSKVGKHKPVADDHGGVPLCDTIMRAAMAASFRVELTDVVLRTDEKFSMNRLPKGDILNAEYVRREHAEAWTFVKYAYDMALPFWEQKLGGDAVSALISDTELCELLRHQPPASEVIIASDDPFNFAEDMAGLKACSESKRITFLPFGGHLGYVGDEWTRGKLLALFEQPKPAESQRQANAER